MNAWTQWCREGLTLCCICFDCKPEDELFVDGDGITWNVCKGMCAIQAGLIE
jgi:hypothetical protein